jgi:hypothetical protein
MTVLAGGLALSQPVGVRVARRVFSITVQHHHLVGQNIFGLRGLLEGRAAMESCKESEGTETISTFSWPQSPTKPHVKGKAMEEPASDRAQGVKCSWHLLDSEPTEITTRYCLSWKPYSRHRGHCGHLLTVYLYVWSLA